MNSRTLLLLLFGLTGVLVELGLFMVFMDLSMRGRATLLWSFAPLPFILFPFVFGWLFITRKWVTMTWAVMLGSAMYCFWYFLSQYGMGFFDGNMMFVGAPAIILACSLILSATMFRAWPKLRVA